MFGKAKPPARQSRLDERVRKAVERPARSIAPPAWVKHIERAVRQAVFRQGALILGTGEKLPIALKNISSTGARVEFFVRRELPEFAVLAEPTLRIKSRVRVVWQRDGAAGLIFIPARALTPAVR